MAEKLPSDEERAKEAAAARTRSPKTSGGGFDVQLHGWLAQSTRQRLTIEAAWPSREGPVGRVLLQAMALAGRGAVDVRAARVVLRREPSAAHGFAVHASFPVYL